MSIHSLLAAEYNNKREEIKNLTEEIKQLKEDIRVLKNDPSEHMKGFEAGYKAAENYYRLNAIIATYTGENWVSSSQPEQPKPSGTERFGQKIERLIAYFEKHARENEKRADDLDQKIQRQLMLWEDNKRAERSSYYLSGKADSYKRAAEKVRELLGESKPYVSYHEGGCSEACGAHCADPPKPAEKWIVEIQVAGGWFRSKDIPQDFSSEKDALQRMSEVNKSFGFLERRPRRVS